MNTIIAILFVIALVGWAVSRRVQSKLIEHTPPEPQHEPRMFDLRSRYWGHDYTWTPEEGGLKGRLTGWHTPRLRKGDFVVIGKDEGSRYRIDEIEHYSNPSDMYTAKVSFAPRIEGEEYDFYRDPSPYV
jgi:MioC protein